MEAHKVDMFLMSHGKYFEARQVPFIQENLSNTDNSRFLTLQSLNLHDPTIILILSLVAGHFGVDRFLIGDTGLGVAKLLTCGGLGIWTVVDWFIIMNRTRQKNIENLTAAIS